MTDFISEFHEGKMTLAEAFAGAWEKRYCAPIECAEEREYRAEQLEELRKCAAIRYMFAHGYKYVLHEDGSKSWRKARKQDMQNKIDLVCAQCGRVIEAAIPGYYGEEYCSVNGENVHLDCMWGWARDHKKECGAENGYCGKIDADSDKNQSAEIQSE